jgi:hypothetical protein
VKVTPTLSELATDPLLLDLPASPAQLALLKSMDGEPLTADERDLYEVCTGRLHYQEGHRFPTVTAMCGARSGKDAFICRPVLIWQALFSGAERHLGRGEIGVIPLIAQNQEATAVQFNYLSAAFRESDLLRPYVDDERTQEIRLTNRVRIKCFPCSRRAARTWSIPGAVLNEVASYRLTGDSATDTEVEASVSRGSITFPSYRLLKISTPWRRQGVLARDYDMAFGKDDQADLLFWRAPSKLMNPGVEGDRLAQELRLNPELFRREFEAEFLEDVAAFFDPTDVDACMGDLR